MDLEIDTFREIMTPGQVARMVLWAKTYKHKEEISFSRFDDQS